MRMDTGVDTGPVLAVAPTPIGARESGGGLLERLGGLGPGLLLTTLSDLAAGRSSAEAQTDNGAVYAPKLSKGLSPVRWDRDAVTVHNQIRALDPFPGTTSYLQEKLLKIGSAELATLNAGEAVPGTVTAVGEDGVEVACGEGRIRLLELQAPGRRMLSVADFQRGFPITVGEVFTS